MAVYMGITAVTRSAMLNVVRDAIDAGGAGGSLKIYDGTRPATGGTATTLLATLTFSYPSAPNASSGVLTFSAITDGTAGASSTATWARLASSSGSFVADCNVGTSSADIILATTTITLGVTVHISSATLTAGNA